MPAPLSPACSTAAAAVLAAMEAVGDESFEQADDAVRALGVALARYTAAREGDPDAVLALLRAAFVAHWRAPA